MSALAPRRVKVRTKPNAVLSLGSVRADEILPLREATRRLGWGSKGARAAKKAGLRVVRFGRGDLVLGADLLAFIKGLGDAGAES